MRRVNTADGPVDDPLRPGIFYPSPDGKHVLTVVRSGNLQTGLTDYELWSFKSRTVQQFVGSNVEDLPRYETLARFSTANYQYAIGSVTWSKDSRFIIFIGRGANGIGRLYRLTLQDRLLEQLTYNSEDIQQFSLSPDNTKIVFAATSPPENWTVRNAQGYALSSTHRLDSLYTTNPADFWNCCRIYSLSLVSGTQVQIDVIPGYLPAPVIISPDSRWAVTTATLQGHFPSSWRPYAFVENELIADSDVVGGTSGAQKGFESTEFVDQFYLIDLNSGSTRPLLEAPIGPAADSMPVTWSTNGRSVVVGPTYLPLSTLSAAESTHRRSMRAIAEVNVLTGEVRRVVDMQRAYGSGGAEQIVKLRWTELACVVIQRRLEWPGDALPEEYYRRNAEGWKRSSQACPAPREKERLVFTLSQDLNTLPEIVVRDLKARRSRVISDLNPRLRARSFGKAQIFRWTDRLGRSHEGGLILPKDYIAGKKYPLVLQTYGFYPKLFLLDGPPLPGRAVFSAQALASRGIVVLQMPREPLGTQKLASDSAYNLEGEMPRFNAMVEAAIGGLEGAGIADPSRVGLTGFSRSATQVIGALTFANRKLCAGVIADGGGITPYAYASEYSAGPFVENAEHEMGGPPWGASLKNWLERSPGFHYENIQAALRMEMFGRWADARWDLYSALRRMRRPVEIIHIPDGNHVLMSPFAVYTSQQGTVDWYAFWLLGEQDPAPEKHRQYSRWLGLHMAAERASSMQTMDSTR